MIRSKIHLAAFILFMGISFDALTQDIIIKKDGSEIQAVVQKISEEQIEYKKFSYREGPTYIISKSEVFMIKYQNGSKEVISIETRKQPNYYNLVSNEETTSKNEASKNTSSQNISSSAHKDYFGSVSVGFGSNHAGLGAKALFGWGEDGDDGLFFSLGTYKSELFWTIGGQAGYGNGWYLIFSVGNLGITTTTKTVYYNGSSYTETNKEKITGWTVSAGKRLSFTPDKRWFVDLGIGYSRASDYNVLAFDVALGIRF